MNGRRNIRLYGYMIIVVILAVCGEATSYLVIKFVVSPRDSRAFYRIPNIKQATFERYLRIRDPLLGWPPPSKIGSDDFDRSGSRPIPAFPEPGTECVSLYGDSFTYGQGVSHSNAWSNILSKKIGCRVANYAVGGYGTDQSLLRFLDNADATSKLVILGIFPHNIMRNVNQYRNLLTGGSALVLKPRFIIDVAGLRLVEMPELSFAQFREMLWRPVRYLKHETFLVGSPNGPMIMTFPYTLLLIKYVLSERVTNRLLGRPSWISFLREDHRSQALQVTTRIVQRFRKETRLRNKRLLVIIFPTPSSFNYYEKTGKLAMAPLTTLLDKLGIEHLDLHRPLLEVLEDRSYCSVLTNTNSCVGHFNAEGNRMVADAVHSYIKSNGVPLR